MQLLLPITQLMLFYMTLGREPLGLSIAYVSHDWNLYEDKAGSESLIGFCSNNFNKTAAFCQNYEENVMSGVCNFFNQFESNEINWVCVT